MSDLISREAAIEAITNYAKFLWDNYHETCPLAGMIDTIDALPTAERVGKWKYETMSHIITGEMRTVRICSECGGGWFRYDLSDGVEDSEPNYCPNCGARMAEGGDAE